jgi:hypothetical protein
MGGLQAHIDAHNGRRNDKLLSAWKRGFSAKLGMYLTAVLTACWKHSVNASYNRRDIIGRASNYIAKQYNDYNEKDLVEVTQETLAR